MYTIIVNQSSFVRLQYWSSFFWKGYHNKLFNWRISWTEQSVYAPICFLLDFVLPFLHLEDEYMRFLKSNN